MILKTITLITLGLLSVNFAYAKNPAKKEKCYNSKLAEGCTKNAKMNCWKWVTTGMCIKEEGSLEPLTEKCEIKSTDKAISSWKNVYKGKCKIGQFE